MADMLVTDLTRQALTDAITHVIDASGLSGSEIANRSGLGRNSISRYLSGERAPRAHEMSLVEMAIGVPGGTINALAQEILYAELHDTLSVA